MIQTPRLTSRLWRVDDLPLAQALWGDPAVMRYLDGRGGLNPEQAQAKLEAEIANEKEFGLQYWPLFTREGNEFVGCCGLKPWRHSPRGGYELGFHLLPQAWGKGYAREAAEAAVEHAAREKKFPHMMAGHHPENMGSQKILEKIGFRYLEHVRFAPTGLMHPSYRLDFLEIREATAMAPVEMLFREYAASLDFDLSFQGFEEELANLPGAYAKPKGRLVLAYVGEDLAGCAALRPLAAQTAEMKRLYVRPAFRGRKIGEKLAQEILKGAKQAGYESIRLDTVPGMDAAIAMYRRLGFREIAPYRPNPVPGALYLELDLRS